MLTLILIFIFSIAKEYEKKDYLQGFLKDIFKDKK